MGKKTLASSPAAPWNYGKDDSWMDQVKSSNGSKASQQIMWNNQVNGPSGKDDDSWMDQVKGSNGNKVSQQNMWSNQVNGPGATKNSPKNMWNDQVKGSSGTKVSQQNMWNDQVKGSSGRKHSPQNMYDEQMKDSSTSRMSAYGNDNPTRDSSSRSKMNAYAHDIAPPESNPRPKINAYANDTPVVVVPVQNRGLTIVDLLTEEDKQIPLIFSCFTTKFLGKSLNIFCISVFIFDFVTYLVFIFTHGDEVKHQQFYQGVFVSSMFFKCVNLGFGFAAEYWESYTLAKYTGYAWYCTAVLNAFESTLLLAVMGQNNAVIVAAMCAWNITSVFFCLFGNLWFMVSRNLQLLTNIRNHSIIHSESVSIR